VNLARIPRRQPNPSTLICLTVDPSCHYATPPLEERSGGGAVRDPLPSAAAARTYGMGSWPVVVEITVPPPYGCLVAPAVRSNRYSCLRRREASRAGSKQRPHGPWRFALAWPCDDSLCCWPWPAASCNARQRPAETSRGCSLQLV
jgi:hypothetical protein